ncbi:MAG: hypothetical protein M1142_01140 [Patescibacteria group bacterium]|nr:hypothetical protein [Patescibacteria group bacterium]
MSAETPKPQDKHQVVFDQKEKPHFQLTQDIAVKCAGLGYSADQTRQFIQFLDGRLEYTARTEGLIAIGLLGRPRQEGEYMVDGVTLWRKSKSDCELTYHGTCARDDTVDDFNNEWYLALELNVRVLDGGIHAPVSYEEYPTVEVFQSTLTGKGRNRFAPGEFVTDDQYEFWGLVTQEQLKKEILTLTSTQEPERGF